ncbi:Cro/CI family transcriptional regulator [Pectobacterium aroidearum]|uniref:Cro/CI family transcriptional regulator n=1 Tax=Pectobacterium aroidearum TaxID=1201031 RepID=UPI00331556AD
MRKIEVVNFFDTQRNVAKALGISEQAVSLWKELIPERAALKLERITEGKLKYNPSFYGGYSDPISERKV